MGAAFARVARGLDAVFAAVFFAAVFAGAFAGAFRPFFGASTVVPAATLFIWRAMRDLCRDAAFLWITCRFAARSRMLAASAIAATASLLSPLAAAACAFFTAVRAPVRTALFRSRCASFWRQRFKADFECAKELPPAR